MSTYEEIGSGKTGTRPYKLIRSKGRPAIVYDGKIWVLEGDLTDAELKEKAPQFIKLIQREKARERKRKLKLKQKTATTPPSTQQPAKTNPFQNIIQSAAATPYGPSFVSKTVSENDIRAQVDSIRKAAEIEKNLLKAEKKKLEESEKLKGEELAKFRLDTAAEIKTIKEESDNEIARLTALAAISEEEIARRVAELNRSSEIALEELKNEYEEKLANLPEDVDIDQLKADFEAEKNAIIEQANRQILLTEEKYKDTNINEIAEVDDYFKDVTNAYEKALTEPGLNLTANTPTGLKKYRVTDRVDNATIKLDGDRLIAITQQGKLLDVTDPANPIGPKQTIDGFNIKRLFEYAYHPVTRDNFWDIGAILKVPLKVKLRKGGASGRLGSDSLSNLQIDEYAEMADIEEYLPAVSIYDLPTLDGETAAFIANTDLHWVAIRVNEDDSVEYYDPLGEGPPEEFFEWLQDESINGQIKINQVKNQSDESSTCGFHALKFLIDRQNGKTWKEATNFNRIEKYMDMSDDAEKKIRPLIKDFRTNNIRKN